jgi:hypothetical protein
MNEAQFEEKLRELAKEFGGAAELQYTKFDAPAAGGSESQNRIEKSINNLQESLDYLRICIKYQLFDLEATRRENEYLKKILGENGNQGPT